jgi:hypothetical protein
MRKDKDQAIILRKAGHSYNEISSVLKVPKSTLSEWFQGQDWSKKIKDKLKERNLEESRTRMVALDKVRGEQLKAAYEQARTEARNELEFLKYHPLFLSGLMIFWGEGSKTIRSQVRVTNVDPEMLKIFLKFLTDICKIPLSNVHASLLLYPELSALISKDYWAGAVGLPLANFRSTTVIQGRHKTNRLRYGVCTIYVSSTYFRVKMLEWLTYLPKELLSNEYYANI